MPQLALSWRSLIWSMVLTLASQRYHPCGEALVCSLSAWPPYLASYAPTSAASLCWQWCHCWDALGVECLFYRSAIYCDLKSTWTWFRTHLYDFVSRFEVIKAYSALSLQDLIILSILNKLSKFLLINLFSFYNFSIFLAFWSSLPIWACLYFDKASLYSFIITFYWILALIFNRCRWYHLLLIGFRQS